MLIKKSLKSFSAKKIDSDDIIITEVDYKELLERKDQSEAQKLLSENRNFIAAMGGINIIRATGEKYRHRQNAVLMEEIIEFKYNSSNIIRNAFMDYLKDDSLEDFFIYAVEIMEEFDFDMQPSVNSSAMDSTRPNGRYKEKNTYEIFSKVNLLDHTAHVMVAFGEYMDNLKHPMHEVDKMIIGFACLFHDFGKSLKLATELGLYVEGMEIGRYRHEELSFKILQIMLEQYEDGKILKNVIFKLRFEIVGNLVYNHHNSIFDLEEKDEKVEIVQFIDITARQQELENAKKAIYA